MNAGEYDKMFELEDRYWWFVGRRRLALALLDRAMPSGGRFLDLGCGTGVVLGELAQRGEAVGLDMSPTALAYCRQRGLEHLVEGRGENLPFGDGEFDAVVALDVFEHIEDHAAAFREAQRVLRPGGVLVLSVPAYRFLWGPHDIALHHFRRYRRGGISHVLAASGLRTERLSYAVFVLFPLVVLTRIIEKRRRGPAVASLPRVPAWLNQALIRLQGFESWLIHRLGWSLPWGSSVVAVARRPVPPPSPSEV